jgi:hypothetical protein
MKTTITFYDGESQTFEDLAPSLDLDNHEVTLIDADSDCGDVYPFAMVRQVVFIPDQEAE